MIRIVKTHTFSMIRSFFGCFPLFPSTQLNAIKNASYGYGLRYYYYFCGYNLQYSSKSYGCRRDQTGAVWRERL